MVESKLLVSEKQLVIPGEVLAEGLDFFPGTGCYRDNNVICSKLLGLVRLKDRFINVISLGGVYIPKQGDGIIGVIEDVQSTFWIVDINSPYDGILPLSEAVGEYVDIQRTDISRYFDVGDIIYAKIFNVSRTKSVQLSMNDLRAKKLRGGRILTVTPSKVPRIIGKEGSMIDMIKQATGCQIVVGQNGIVWINGEKESLATKAILVIEKNSHISGLTEKISEMLKSGNQ